MRILEGFFFGEGLLDISEGMGSLKRFRAPSGIFNDVLPGSILEGSLSIVGGILQSVVSNAPGFIFNSTFRDPPGGGGGRRDS